LSFPLGGSQTITPTSGVARKDANVPSINPVKSWSGGGFRPLPTYNRGGAASQLYKGTRQPLPRPKDLPNAFIPNRGKQTGMSSQLEDSEVNKVSVY